MSEFNEFKPRLKFAENLNRIQFKVEPTIYQPRLSSNSLKYIFWDMRAINLHNPPYSLYSTLQYTIPNSLVVIDLHHTVYAYCYLRGYTLYTVHGTNIFVSVHSVDCTLIIQWYPENSEIGGRLLNSLNFNV